MVDDKKIDTIIELHLQLISITKSIRVPFVYTESPNTNCIGMWYLSYMPAPKYKLYRLNCPIVYSQFVLGHPVVRTTYYECTQDIYCSMYPLNMYPNQ